MTDKQPDLTATGLFEHLRAATEENGHVRGVAGSAAWANLSHYLAVAMWTLLMKLAAS